MFNKLEILDNCPLIFPILSIFNWVQPSFYDLIILISIGIFTQFAQYFMTKSFQSEKVSKVSIVSYSELVFVVLIGNIFFNENFDILVYIGMLLVTFGVVFNILLSKDDKKYL